MKQEHPNWMKQALKEAEKAFKSKEIPVGAVITKNGKVFSIDKDPITNKIANKFFKEAKVLKKIKTKINNAMTEVKSLLKNPLIIDLRNIYREELMKEYGIEYLSIGRGKINL